MKEIVKPRNEGYFDKVFLDNFRPGTIIDDGSYKVIFIKQLEEKIDIKDCSLYLFKPNKDYANYIRETYNSYPCKVFECALCDITSEMNFTSMPTSTSHILDSKYQHIRLNQR